MWGTYLVLAAVLAGLVSGLHARSLTRGLLVGAAVMFLPIALVVVAGFGLLKLGMNAS